ncbi:conjugative transposon TraK protein [Flavobacterium croceum DSM 17960]|uniref:Conjugative transposon TraK protein n=1 Tax=Flavobacterium croceum DSM 17960 TaxID=1121886 RepID=A0A2S4N6F8_9FLAO|nr:conjugative transposon protein TraK [Flavobacterium croceum]POS00903.1 conjugative transposon TraK protein [Flavobacterium croceum DSM 17960]
MKELKNLDYSIKTFRIFGIAVILICFVFSISVYFYSMSLVEKSKDKVYLLNNGNALELVRSRNLLDNVKAEIKSHVTMFHEFFFNLDPDPQDIKKRVTKALNLIDDTGRQLESSRNESMYYHKMIEGAISSRFYLDSISLQQNNNIYYCKIFAKQKLERSSKIVFKNLIAECRIRQTSRTDDNPHGLLIENYLIKNNETINEINK